MKTTSSHIASIRRAATAVTAVLVLTSCATYPTTTGDSPGTNLEIDGVKIRYAHLEAPEDPDGWETGDDVPLYVWLHNSSGEPRTLTGASSPIASKVTLSEGAFPVDLPTMEWAQLERGAPHLVLHDIEEQVRGAEFVTVTLEFASGRTAVMDVEAVDPNPDPPQLPTSDTDG
ncbi:copper chaperone PCu(A)C [Knoellia sinensis]|nr:copper chaperone PCu(A)C [Knoellia sinensis]